MQTTMTRAQYDAIVQAKGAPWADAWRQRNQIQVEGMQPVAYQAYNEDTEDTEESPTGGLGGLAAGDVPSIQNVYAQQAALSKDILGTLSGMEKRRAEQYAQATEELKQRRFGPSRAEQLFQLAAAIGKPTLNRSFGSIMANVTPALGEIAQANRVATEERSAAAQALREKYLGEQQATQLAALQERRKALADTADLAKAYAKPRVDRPVGSPVVVGNKLVAVTQNLDTGALTQTVLGDAPVNLKPIPGTTSGGQPVFMGPKGPVDARGNPVSDFDVKPKPVSATEQRQIFNTEDAINTGLSTVRSLEEALSLNSQAYEGSLSGWRKTLGQLFSSDDPRYVATENFDNLQISSAIGNLKNVFPGAISNDERKAFNDLQAVSKYPREVRDQMIRRALDAAKRVIARETKRLEGLKSGDYSTRGGSTVGQDRVIRYDKTGKRI